MKTTLFFILLLSILTGCNSCGDESASTSRVKVLQTATVEFLSEGSCSPTLPMDAMGTIDCTGLSTKTCMDLIKNSCSGDFEVTFNQEVEVETSGSKNFTVTDST